MKLPPCAELQDRCPLPPAHLSLPTHQLQTYCVALTYLHLVSGGNLKVPSPAGLAHTGFAFDTQQMQPCPWSNSHVLAAATAKVRQGGRAAMHPLGSREVGKQTYSSLGFTSGRRGGTALTSPKCLSLLGRKKQRKTNNVIQCLQKRNNYFPTGFRGSCWGEREEQKK